MAAAAAKGPKVPHGTIAALPDELLAEVFSRVRSIKDLFRCAATCTRWLRLFGDPAFLRSLCPGDGKGGHRARLLGFVFQETSFFQCCRSMVEMRMAQRTSVSPPTFLPTPGSPLGEQRDLAGDDVGDFNYAEPLAARHGIVLMQLVPHTFDLESKKGTVGHHQLFGLCNPATGERHVLPPLDPVVDDVHGYAIVVTAADGDLAGNGKQRSPPISSSSGRFGLSHLILLAGHVVGSDERHIHWYSAATRSWAAPHNTGTNLYHAAVVGERSAVVHRAAHWLCVNGREASRTSAAAGDGNLCKLSVDLGSGHVSFVKLAVRAGGTPLLWVSRDGKLSVACVYPSHATVWTQQREEEEEGAWVRTGVFRLPMPAASFPNDVMMLEQWFWFDRGTMLVLYRGGGVYVLDIEEEAMEKVMDCFPIMYTEKWLLTYVPYEMDLVEFFVSRLGGMLCRG